MRRHHRHRRQDHGDHAGHRDARGVGRSRRSTAGNTEVPLVDGHRRPGRRGVRGRGVVVPPAATPTRSGPRSATWLNFAADHLDLHADLDAYEAAKARIWARPGARRPGRRPTPTTRWSCWPRCAGAGRGGDVRARRRRRLARSTDGALRRPGRRRRSSRSTSCPAPLPHDLANALAAAATARWRRARRSTRVRAALRVVRGPPPPRRSWWARLTACAGTTTPRPPTPARHRGRGRPGFDSVVLIAGGRNKGLDLGGLRAAAAAPAGRRRHRRGRRRGRRRLRRRRARWSGRRRWTRPSAAAARWRRARRRRAAVAGLRVVRLVPAPTASGATTSPAPVRDLDREPAHERPHDRRRAAAAVAAEPPARPSPTRRAAPAADPSAPPARRATPRRSDRAAPRRRRRAQPARPGDGAVGVVGQRPARDRARPGTTSTARSLWVARRRRRPVRRPRGSTTAAGGAGRARCSLVAVVLAGCSCSCPASASRSTARSRWLGVGAAAAPAVRVGQAGPAPVRRRPAGPARRPACTTPRGHARARCSWCSAPSPCWCMLQPNLGTTIVLGRHRVRRCCSSPAPRCGSLAGSGWPSAGARRCAAPCVEPLPPGAAAGLPRPVGRPAEHRLPDHPVAGRRSPSGGLARRRPRRQPGQVGLPARRPHRLHLRHHRRGARPGRRRSSCSACSSPSACSASAPRSRAPDRFGMLLAAGITAWFCVQAFVNIGAVIGAAARSPACRCRSSPSAARRWWSTMAAAGMLLNIARHGRDDRRRPTTDAGDAPAPGRSIAGGGTAGHVLPGLAVGRALVDARPRPVDDPLRRQRPRASRRALVPEAGFALTLLPGRGIQRRLTLANVGAVVGLVAGRGPRRSALVRRRRPAVVVALGGYASVAVRARPPCCARVPIVRGRAERACRARPTGSSARFAKACGGVVPGHRPAPGRRHRQPGAARDPGRRPRPRPRRRPRAAARPARRPARSSLVVRRLARAPARSTRRSRARSRGWARPRRPRRPPRRRRRATGPITGADAAERRRPALVYQAVAYEDRHADLLLAAADVVVCRAGGSTWPSWPPSGCPASWCRCPIATGDHQTANARRLVDAGAARARARRRARRRPPGGRARRPARRPGRLGGDGRRGRAPSARPDAADAGRRPRRGARPWLTAPARASTSPRPARVHVVGVGGAGMSAIATVLAAMGHRSAGSDLQGRRAGLDRLRGRGRRRSPSATTPANVGRRRRWSPSRPPSRDATPRSSRPASAGIPVLRRAEIAGRHRRARGAPSRWPAPTARPRLVDAGPGARRGRPATRRSSSAARSTRSARGAVWDDGELVRRRGRRERRHLPRARAPRSRSSPTSSPTTSSTTAASTALAGGLRPLPGRRRRPGRASAPTTPARPRLGRAPRRRVTYGTRRGADYRIVDVAAGRRPASAFALSSTAARRSGEVDLPVPGLHNARNAAGRRRRRRSARRRRSTPRPPALARFAGVARRFQFRGEAGGVTFVDDYAHLPDRGARPRSAAGRGRRGAGSCACSSPTATAAPRRCGATFADAFVDADVLVVTDIYAAGEAPRPGVTGKLVVDAVLDAHPWQPVAWLPAPRRRCVAYLRGRAAARRPLPHARGRRPHLAARRAARPRCGAGVTTAGGRSTPVAAADAASATGARRDVPLGPLHHLPGRRPGGRCSSRSTTSTTCAAVAGAVAGQPASPVLVVGQGLEPARGRRRVRRPGRRAGRARSPAIDVDGDRRSRAGGAAACRWWPAAPRPPGSPGSSGRSACPGSVGGAVRMNAGGHGSDMAATLRGSASSTSRTGEDGVGARGRPRPRLPPLVGRAPRRSWSRPSSRLAPGDRGGGEAEIAEIVRWRREQPARRPERRLGVHQPAGRLRRPADRRRRVQGPARAARPRCRPSTPTSSRPTTGGSADDVLALMARGAAPGASGTPASTCVPETRLVGLRRPTARRAATTVAARPSPSTRASGSAADRPSRRRRRAAAGCRRLRRRRSSGRCSWRLGARSALTRTPAARRRRRSRCWAPTGRRPTAVDRRRRRPRPAHRRWSTSTPSRRPRPASRRCPWVRRRRGSTARSWPGTVEVDRRRARAGGGAGHGRGGWALVDADRPGRWPWSTPGPATLALVEGVAPSARRAPAGRPGAEALAGAAAVAVPAILRPACAAVAGHGPAASSSRSIRGERGPAGATPTDGAMPSPASALAVLATVEPADVRAVDARRRACLVPRPALGCSASRAACRSGAG